MSVFNCNYSQTRNRHDPSPPSVVLPVVTSVQRSDDGHPLCVTHPGSLASSVWWRRCTGRLTSTARLDDQQPIAAVCCSRLLLPHQHRVLLSHYLSIPNLARCPSICLPFYLSLSLYIYIYRSIWCTVANHDESTNPFIRFVRSGSGRSRRRRSGKHTMPGWRRIRLAICVSSHMHTAVRH